VGFRAVARERRVLFAAVALATIVVSSVLVCACSGSATPSGTLLGSIRVAGGPPPGINLSVNGTVVAHGDVTVSAKATAKNGFVLRLPAGTYALDGTTTYIGGGGHCTAAAKVTVDDNKTSHMRLQCDIP
jgi:uncharacterized protein (DUF2126 family)